MNSREQVSNGYDDTSTGDEQIRSMVSFQFQEIVDGDKHGDPGLEQEDGSERRRTEDEDDMLGMTQTVSTFNNRAQSMGRTERVSPMVSERDWTSKCSGAGAYEGWGDEDEMRCRCA